MCACSCVFQDKRKIYCIFSSSHLLCYEALFSDNFFNLSHHLYTFPCTTSSSAVLTGRLLDFRLVSIWHNLQEKPPSPINIKSLERGKSSLRHHWFSKKLSHPRRLTFGPQSSPVLHDCQEIDYTLLIWASLAQFLSSKLASRNVTLTICAVHGQTVS